MIMTELQYASLVISLSTLGQTDLADNDLVQLRTLAHLLEAAESNVRRTIASRDDRTGELADEKDSAFEYPPRDYDR